MPNLFVAIDRILRELQETSRNENYFPGFFKNHRTGKLVHPSIRIQEIKNHQETGSRFVNRYPTHLLLKTLIDDSSHQANKTKPNILHFSWAQEDHKMQEGSTVIEGWRWLIHGGFWIFLWVWDTSGTGEVPYWGTLPSDSAKLKLIFRVVW